MHIVTSGPAKLMRSLPAALFSSEAIAALKRAYKTLYKSGLSFAEAKEALRAQATEVAEVKVLADSLDAATRGIVR